MHTVSACGKSDIHTIVHKQSCLAASRDLHCTRCEFVKHARGQRLLTYLNNGKLCRYDTLKKTEDVSGCMRRRPAARYWINDWTWKFERHRLQIVSLSSYGFAKQRPCV